MIEASCSSGRPIRAFHGTTAAENFSEFEYTEDVGFHFGSAAAANKRLKDILEGEDESGWEHARILICDLIIAKPLRLVDCATWSPQSVLSALQRAGALDQSAYQSLRDDGYLDQLMLLEIVEAAGFDSIVYENETELGGDSYLVLKPEQIRFALVAPPESAPLKRSRHRPR